MPERCDSPSVPLRKLKIWKKTRFTFKVILFQKNLKFKHTIPLCYGQQESLEFQGHVLNTQVWAIAQVVTNTLGPMVQQCVLNQAKVTDYFLTFLLRQFH